MRIITLDVGEKRIGIAASDALGITAQGIMTYHRKNLAADYEFLAQLLKKEEATLLLVGMPRNMDGSYGPQAQAVRSFAEGLGEHISVPTEFWDERLSTRAATRTLIEADVSRKKRKQVVDKLAAVHILQGYLDYLSMKGRMG